MSFIEILDVDQIIVYPIMLMNLATITEAVLQNFAYLV